MLHNDCEKVVIYSASLALAPSISDHIISPKTHRTTRSLQRNHLTKSSSQAYSSVIALLSARFTP